MVASESCAGSRRTWMRLRRVSADDVAHPLAADACGARVRRTSMAGVAIGAVMPDLLELVGVDVVVGVVVVASVSSLAGCPVRAKNTSSSDGWWISMSSTATPASSSARIDRGGEPGARADRRPQPASAVDALTTAPAASGGERADGRGRAAPRA